MFGVRTRQRLLRINGAHDDPPVQQESVALRKKAESLRNEDVAWVVMGSLNDDKTLDGSLLSPQAVPSQ